MAELRTHRDTHTSLPHVLYNSEYLHSTASSNQLPFPLPHQSITRQNLTRVSQWLLCEHRTQERFPALRWPRGGWLSAHSAKAWLGPTSSGRAPLPRAPGRWLGPAVGRAGSGGAGSRLERGPGAGSELQLYYGFHQSGGQVTARFRCVGQSRTGVCCKPAKTGKVISLVTATNWNHDVRGAGTAALLINDRTASAEQTNPTSHSHALCRPYHSR